MRSSAKRISVALLAALAAPAAFAEEISLEAAMALGRANAYQVTAAEARAYAAEERVSQARAYRLPRVSVEVISLSRVLTSPFLNLIALARTIRCGKSTFHSWGGT